MPVETMAYQCKLMYPDYCMPLQIIMYADYRAWTDYNACSAADAVLDLPITLQQYDEVSFQDNKEPLQWRI